jgi:predicted permease
MRRWSRLKFLARNLLRTQQLESQLDEELRSYAGMVADEKIADGMPASEARRTTLADLGGIEQVKQSVRDRRTGAGLELLWQDVRYALRQLRRNRAFTLTAVLTLGLGIGATTAIFSLVEGVLLRPLPFHDPARLVTLNDALEGEGLDGMQSVTSAEVGQYIRNTSSFASLGAYTSNGYELSGRGEPAQINGTRLTGGVFPTLGVQPILGRVFTQQEDDQHQQVAVLSYSTWQSRFHGDPGVIGSKLLLDRKPYEVIGVMPRNFEFPLAPGRLNQSELWVPMSFTAEELSFGASNGNWNFQMVGRLKPGITIEHAQQDANRVAQDVMRNFPPALKAIHIHGAVDSLKESAVAAGRPLVRILTFAVLVVLLIACLNVAGLLLVRAIRRRRELAVRLALGASPRALVGSSLVEGLLLSGSGGLLGLLLAAATLKVAVPLLPESMPRVEGIHLDIGVIFFALCLALITGALCGMAPAFAALRTRVNENLKEGGRTGTSGSSHGRLRSALVVTRSPSPSSCSLPRAHCCAASRRCAMSIPASALTTYSWLDTICPPAYTARRTWSIPSTARCWSGWRRCPARQQPA